MQYTKQKTCTTIYINTSTNKKQQNPIRYTHKKHKQQKHQERTKDNKTLNKTKTNTKHTQQNKNNNQ